MQDLRIAIRMLRTNRSVALVAILALAIGIGASTAIFSVVNSVLLRPLPYQRADRLATVQGSYEKLGIARMGAKAAEYLDFKTQSKSFEEMGAYTPRDLTLTGGGQPEVVFAAAVTTNLLPMVGAAPLLGRNFQLGEDESNRTPVVILSHAFWQRRFGGDRTILERTLTLDGAAYQIVGVTPEGFQFPHRDSPGSGRIDLWTPIHFSEEQISKRQQPYYLKVVGRLKDGVSIEQANADLASLATRMEETLPGYQHGGWRVNSALIREEMIGGSRRALLILLGAVGMVLLIACANVANLLLMRATVRAKELAVRSALGASRRRLIRQLLIESLTLAGLGGAAGLLLAWWAIKLLAWIKPGNLPRVEEITLDARVFAFAAIVSIITGLLFGSAPAWTASRPDLQKMLKEGGVAPSRSRRAFRNLLVTAEVAVAVLLLAGAGLLINSFLRLQRVRTGVEVDRVLTAFVGLPDSKYDSPTKLTAFYKELLNRIEALPGVESASAGTALPLGGGGLNDPIMIEGRKLEMSNPSFAAWQIVTPRHFKTLGVPILRGRGFDERDNADAPPVAVINESMARKYWPNEDPIGKRFSLGLASPKNPFAEIVGIARDIPHRAIDSKPEPNFYFSALQRMRSHLYLFIHSTADPASLGESIRRQVQAIDPDQPLTEVRTLNEVIASTTAPRRFNTVLFGVFAAAALTLASLGVYSVIAYSVTQRTQEIGVRMALGARGADVVRLILRQGMIPVAAGVTLGLGGALASTRVMKSLLFEVSPTDPLTFALIVILLTAVALCACLVPARRAAKVDPMVALRRG
jgi:putative ABC transport system permease protein